MKKGRVGTTTEQLRQALEKGKLQPDRPSLESIRYHEPEELFVLQMSNGKRRFIAKEELQGLGEAKKKQLGNIEILGLGTGVYWPDLDVAFGVSGLLDGVYGSRKWMSDLARYGSIAQVNGRKTEISSRQNKSELVGKPAVNLKPETSRTSKQKATE